MGVVVSVVNFVTTNGAALNRSLNGSLKTPMVSLSSFVRRHRNGSVSGVFTRRKRNGFQRVRLSYLRRILRSRVSRGPRAVRSRAHYSLILSLNNNVIVAPTYQRLVSEFACYMCLGHSPRIVVRRLLTSGGSSHPILRGTTGSTSKSRVTHVETTVSAVCQRHTPFCRRLTSGIMWRNTIIGLSWGGERGFRVLSFVL